MEEDEPTNSCGYDGLCDTTEDWSDVFEFEGLFVDVRWVCLEDNAMKMATSMMLTASLVFATLF